MKSLPTRILSAIVALVILVLAHLWGGKNGWLAIGLFACSVGAYEYHKIAFSPLKAPKGMRLWFLAVALLLLALTVFNPPDVLNYWGILIAAFIAGALWLLRGRQNNETLLTTVAIGVLGLVYCVMLPTFALKLLPLENGFFWFIFLIAVVFVGDVSAYFGGILLGKNKLMPQLSPSKTVAGAVSGTLGSIVTGCVIAFFWLPQAPVWSIALTSLVASLLAQNGDLFESLVKRVADVKDSGRIMPGHGGILDRLDGIYFAAPLVYGVSQWLS